MKINQKCDYWHEKIKIILIRLGYQLIIFKIIAIFYVTPTTNPNSRNQRDDCF